jgi:predicted dehydrogenase
MRRIQMGIIGCGVIGRIHLSMAAQMEHIQIAAVADTNMEAALSQGKAYGVTAIYNHGFALIDDPAVEAVVIALPTCARLDLTLYALSKGKHILIEKPGGMNAGEVETIIRARGSVVAASCSSRFRFLETAKVLTDFLQSDALGQLRVVRYRYIKPAGEKPENPPFWRYNKQVNGGGIMANWGTYDLDFLFAITSWKLKPREVLACVWTAPAPFQQHVAEKSDAETHLSAFIRCESGTIITLERGELVAAQPDATWEIIGDKGSLSFYMLPKDNKEILFHRADPDTGVVTSRIWQGNESWDTTHSGVISDFASAIIENRQPVGTLEEACLIQQVIDAIYLSSEESRAVML